MSAEMLRRAASLMRFDEDGDGDYIASWHPAVALAVADLLDDGATYLEFMEREHPDEPAGDYGQYFLAVARAYLGGP